MSDLMRNIFDFFGFTKTPDVPTVPAVPPPNDISLSLLNLHNNVRLSKYSLVLNTSLNKAAQDYAELMAKNGFNAFSHTEGGTTDIDRANKAGYNSSYVGENVEYGSATADDCFDIWMGSPGHHANIVNANYKDVGFGYAKSVDGTPYWCALFGRIW